MSPPSIMLCKAIVIGSTALLNVSFHPASLSAISGTEVFKRYTKPLIS
jgi:hypothetical protein